MPPFFTSVRLLLLRLYGEGEEDCGHDQRKGNDVVPLHALLQVESCEGNKDENRYGLLDNLKLESTPARKRAVAVCRYLEHILHSRYEPAYQYHFPERRILVTQ